MIVDRSGVSSGGQDEGGVIKGKSEKRRSSKTAYACGTLHCAACTPARMTAKLIAYLKRHRTARKRFLSWRDARAALRRRRSPTSTWQQTVAPRAVARSSLAPPISRKQLSALRARYAATRQRCARLYLPIPGDKTKAP